MINRAKMIYVYLAFLLVWFTGVVIAAIYLDNEKWTAIGLATAGGVFLGAFKDSWQFLWRKASNEEKQGLKLKQIKDDLIDNSNQRINKGA